MTQERQSRAVVERFVEEFYRKGNLDVFDEILAPDFFFAGVGAEIQGDIEKLKEIALTTHSMLQNAAPDMEFHVEEMVVDGNAVAIRLTERGTFTGPYVAGPTRIEPTGKPFQLTAMELFHVEDGKIKERWATRDRLGFLQQVGAPVKIG